MNYSFISNNKELNNISNINYSNIKTQNNEPPEHMPTFLIFQENKHKYFERYSQINLNKHNNNLQNKYLSSSNINLINKKLQHKIKKKKDIQIDLQNPTIIYKIMEKIFKTNYNNLNNIDYEINRLNNIALKEIEIKTVNNLLMKQRYFKDINDISYIYKDFKYPINTSSSGAKLTNTVDRMIYLDN